MDDEVNLPNAKCKFRKPFEAEFETNGMPGDTDSRTACMNNLFRS